MTGKIAVLIDADNAQPCKASLVLAEVAKYGAACVKRAYGDWTGPNLNGWKEQLLENSIQPIQQFAYTKGKNSTDAAMVIDAMDLLYSGQFDGFFLVSSDSDFTRLASRIRESALPVYGCGTRRAPLPFATACDKFIYVENLTPHVNLTKQIDDSTHIADSANHQNDSIEAADWLRAAVEATSDEDGWAGLCDVGQLVVKRHPAFDSRNYGHTKLSGLIASLHNIFETTRRSPATGKEPVPYVRKK